MLLEEEPTFDSDQEPPFALLRTKGLSINGLDAMTKEGLRLFVGWLHNRKGLSRS